MIPQNGTNGTAVAYYRVSTQQQGRSGLGLDAQRQSVQAFAERSGLSIVAEFTEVETGTRKRERVEIARAIAEAQERKSTLLIAKIDRLARNVAFVSTLMESGVDFVAVDMPQANKLTIHIIAAMAEHEADMISRRTRDALRAAKARGKQLGKPENLSQAARLRGAAVNLQRARTAYRTKRGYIQLLRESGMTLRQIADRLNREGHRTRNGRKFHAQTVKRILERP